MTTNLFSIITDEVSQDLATITRFAQTHGLRCIELRSFAGRAFKDLTISDLAAIRSRANGEGWRVVACASPVFKCELTDQAEIERHREYFKRSVDAARSLDCDLVRVFTFLRKSVASAAEWGRMVDNVRGLLSLARDSGVRVVVENEHSCMVATPTEMQELGDAIADPTLGLLWDPCNVLYLPGLQTLSLTVPHRLASRILHVHVKDAWWLARPGAAAAASAPVGLGDVDWRKRFIEILGLGYRGCLSLETHWRVRPLAESALHLPAGFDFSHGGEEASSVCLQNARALWAHMSGMALKSMRLLDHSVSEETCRGGFRSMGPDIYGPENWSARSECG